MSGREGGAVVHTVLYDDGDVRSYDMTTRDYQLLTAPIHSAGTRQLRALQDYY